MNKLPLRGRWHLWYTDIERSSGVSWLDPNEAKEYGLTRSGIPIPCGHPNDDCWTSIQAGTWHPTHPPEVHA